MPIITILQKKGEVLPRRILRIRFAKSTLVHFQAHVFDFVELLKFGVVAYVVVDVRNYPIESRVEHLARQLARCVLHFYVFAECIKIFIGERIGIARKKVGVIRPSFADFERFFHLFVECCAILFVAEFAISVYALPRLNET